MTHGRAIAQNFAFSPGKPMTRMPHQGPWLDRRWIMADNNQAESHWTGWHTFSLLVMIALITLLGLLTPPQRKLWAWLGTMVLLGIFATVAGQGITNLWRGVLIDERKKVRLSRLQMT